MWVTPEAGDSKLKVSSNYESLLEASFTQSWEQVSIAYNAADGISGSMGVDPHCFRNKYAFLRISFRLICSPTYRDKNGRYVPNGSPLYAVAVAVPEYDFNNLPPIVQRRGLARLD